MKLSELIPLLPGPLVLKLRKKDPWVLLSPPETTLVYVIGNSPERCGHNFLTYGFSANYPINPNGVHSCTYIGLYPIHVGRGNEPEDGDLVFGEDYEIEEARKATEVECESVKFSYS